MKKILNKALTLLLTLFLLVGCTSFSNQESVATNTNLNLEEISNTYLTKLKDFKSKKRNKDNTSDNEEFDAFLDKMFIDLISDDYTTLIEFIKDYKTLGIEKPEVTLGEINYGADESVIQREIDEYNTLQSFDYDSLSYRQQIDYECVEYSIYEDLSCVAYYKYSRLFSSDASFISSIMDYLVNFKFWDEEYVEDYITLVKDIDRYIEDAISYTDQQYKDGIYYSDYSLDNSIEYIESVVSKVEDNTLITAFENNLNELDFLSDSQKQEYLAENKQIVTEEVIPTLNNLKDKLETYKGKCESKDLALCNVSSEYAQTAILLQCSDNSSVDDIYDQLIDAYNDMVKLFNTYDENSDVVKEYEELFNDDQFKVGYKELVDGLIDCLDDDNEIKTNLNYSIDELDESMADNTTTAYYIRGPFDVLNSNIVKVNPNFVKQDLDLYLTLAHETVPGHMYEKNVYRLSNPSYIREAMKYIGYDEGYASFAEYMALDNLDISDELKEYVINNSMIDYLYCALVDISVNYYGYSVKDLRNAFGMDTSNANHLIDFFTDMATAYEPYGVGYMKMANLYTSTKEKLGDKFDMDEYENILIKNGPMPYPILESIIDEYIEIK